MIKNFLNFPLKLHIGIPYYMPNLYKDEKALFKKNWSHKDNCKHIFFLAEIDGKCIGYIGAIL